MRPDLDKTDQQLFDTMVAHLRTQGTTAILDGMSAYHGLDYRRCPVGAVIPDDLYDVRMEGKDITQLSKLQASWINPELNMMFRWHHTIFRALQQVHDTVHPELWEYQFRLIAAKYHLLLDGNPVVIPPNENTLYNNRFPGKK
jgi:hypothetical protein